MHRRLEMAGAFEIISSNPLILQRRRVITLWTIGFGWKQGVSVTTRLCKRDRPELTGFRNAEAWALETVGGIMSLPVLVFVNGLRDTLFPARNLALLSTSPCLTEHYLPSRTAAEFQYLGKDLGLRHVCVRSRAWAVGGLASRARVLTSSTWVGNGCPLVKTKTQTNKQTNTVFSFQWSFWLDSCHLYVPKTPDLHVWDKISFCSANCSDGRKCLLHFTKPFLCPGGEAGNGGQMALGRNESDPRDYVDSCTLLRLDFLSGFP